MGALWRFHPWRHLGKSRLGNNLVGCCSSDPWTWSMRHFNRVLDNGDDIYMSIIQKKGKKRGEMLISDAAAAIGTSSQSDRAGFVLAFGGPIEDKETGEFFSAVIASR